MVVASNGSGHLRLGAGGSEKVRITSAGLVGIGTITPGSALEIRTTTINAATHYRNNASNGGAYFGVRATDLGAADAGEAYVYSYNSGINLLADGNGDINFATGGTASRVRIKDNGNTGIGTDNPVALLNPHGTAELTNTDQVVLISDSNADDAIGRGGNLGFAGYVNGNLRTLAGIGGIKRNAGNSFNGDLALYTRVNGQPNLYPRLRILSDGNVGINETNPIGDLSITGANGSTMEFQPDIVSGTNRITNFNRSTSTYKAFRLDASQHEFLISGTEKVRISSGGLAINKNTAADTDIEILQSADPTLRLYDTRNSAYKADFMMAGSAPLIRNNNTTASDRTLTVQKGTTDHLVIEGGGQVATPLQPRFLARLSANVSYNPSGFGDHLHFNTEDYDIGGNFTTSGADIGLFTAPISGNYAFSAASYASGILQTQSWFTVNGSRKAASDWVPNQSGNFVQNFQIIYLSTGDKVGFHPHRGGTSSFTVNANTHHTYFKGCLLG